MNNGFIKLHRKMLEWEWYQDANVKSLFLHCLLKANHKDKRWQGITIKRGSFITGYDVLSKELGLTKRQIRTAVTKLKSTGEMSHRPNNRYSIVTLTHYDSYQDRESIEANNVSPHESVRGHSEVTQATPHESVRGHSEVTQATPTKNVKNVKNDKNKDIAINQKEIKFNEFWKTYGKSVTPAKCKKKFLTLTEKDIGLIFKTLPNYISSTPEKQYRKNPLTYLNNQSWNDEIIIPTASIHNLDGMQYKSGAI